MGSAHSTLTQAGLNIFSIQVNVTVVLDPNKKKNFVVGDTFIPRFQDSIKFQMYTSGTDVDLPNVEYLLQEIEETCLNIENGKEFLLTAKDMYVYVRRDENTFTNIENVDCLDDNEDIFVFEYPHTQDLSAKPLPTLTAMKANLGMDVDSAENRTVDRTEINPINSHQSV
eukprot:g14838.t1